MSAALDDPRVRAPWRPTPLVAASIGLHGLAGLAALAAPESWPWALGAVGANHGVLSMAGMWPRGSLLGPNMTRLPEASRRRGEIAITFDDGPDPEVTPRVLDLLEARGCRATFFCIAQRVREHAALCREIARRGHAVENHSMAHRATFPFLTLGGFRREIAGAQLAIAEATGTAPRFFRAPAGLRNPFLDPALHEAGLALVTWTRRGFDTRERDAAVVAARLVRGLAAGDILLLHDGHAARTRSGGPVVLEALPRVLDAAEAAGLRPVALPRAIEP
jgi:peptidoglycan-N-acetylglucosamine deacetylase